MNMKMKKVLFSFAIPLVLTGCSPFDNNGKKAIEICQAAKVQVEIGNNLEGLFLNSFGLGGNANWLDFANIIAKQDPNKKYSWNSSKTKDKRFYLVEFTDSSGWGQRWEVDVDQQIVKYVNQNEYLCRKYGLSRFDGNSEFEITGIEHSDLRKVTLYNYWTTSSTSQIVYEIRGSVLNKTNKSIVSANIDGKLKLIFQDKTVEEGGDYGSGFKERISENNPWEPNTLRKFYIKTNGVKKIYLNYLPEYVVMDISLNAKDPVGYTYSKDVSEIDLKDKWKLFKDNSASISSEQSEKLALKSRVKKRSSNANASQQDFVEENGEDNPDTISEPIDASPTSESDQ